MCVILNLLMLLVKSFVVVFRSIVVVSYIWQTQKFYQLQIILFVLAQSSATIDLNTSLQIN